MSKKTNIKYVVGDATAPQGESKKIICHICNDIGAWGAGFVLALSNKWRYPEDFYRARHTYPLGHADVLSVEENVYVANMIAQRSTRPDSKGVPPIRYDALKDTLSKSVSPAVPSLAKSDIPLVRVVGFAVSIKHLADPIL